MAVLKPGSIDDAGNWIEWDGMARYMEEALPPSPDPEDSGKFGRRQFLIAISTGVIDYLKLHQNDGFVVHTNVNNTEYTGSVEIR
jgi:hypothetical protein